MPTQLLTAFEVLASPVAPGVPNVPYVQQGFFLQITNLGVANAFLGLEYQGNPAFVQSVGAVKLFTNVIDSVGQPQQYPAAAFLGAPVGFEALDVPAGATILVGVQYLLLPPPAFTTTAATGTTPQDAFTTRGIVHASADPGTKFFVLATVRQVFTTYDGAGALVSTDSAAYSVPINGGPELSF